METQLTSVAGRLSIHVPFSKFDEARGVVGGYAAEEAPDRSSEIMDYAKARPRFEAWSESQKAASGGKSLGNVRAMHGKVAAGVVEHLEFQDAEKRVYVEAKIVDADSLNKVKAGVYTGFSIGGSYAEKWADGNLTRYVPEIQEVSLVDRPCMPGAVFTVVKADGSTEERPLVGRVTKQVWTCTVEGHEHVAKAEALACQGEVVVEKVGPALETDSKKRAKVSRPADLEKCMSCVSMLARVLADLDAVRQIVGWEAESENDGSPLPAALNVEVAHIGELLIELTEEEAGEMGAADDDELAAWAPARVQKVIAKAEAWAVHAREGQEMNPEELKKVVGDQLTKAMDEAVEKIGQRIDTVQKAVDERFEKLAERLEVVEKATPQKGGPRLRVIGKGEDTADEMEKLTTDLPDTVHGLIRKSLRAPIEVVAGAARPR